MFKTSLKSKLIIAVMVIFGITAFMSCEKEETTSIFDNTNTKNVVNNTKSNTPYIYDGIEYYYYLDNKKMSIENLNLVKK